MNNPPLKVFLPSDIAAAFCATLRENDITFRPSFTGANAHEVRSGPGFIVNSADLKEIIISLAESKPFWTFVGSAVWAFTKRHSHKSVYIETDKIKFKASGMSSDEISRFMQDAKSLTVTETDNPEK
ncbi:hypothetical protein [Tatumella citrea]|uniref:hypothetical protein n=1 Tax=Tatumella citrea TaxID=53336 RepID=UPI0012FC1BD8|nr:hypothetical protein [Tatumella citrea]